MITHYSENITRITLYSITVNESLSPKSYTHPSMVKVICDVKVIGKVKVMSNVLVISKVKVVSNVKVISNLKVISKVKVLSKVKVVSNVTHVYCSSGGAAALVVTSVAPPVSPSLIRLWVIGPWGGAESQTERSWCSVLMKQQQQQTHGSQATQSEQLLH